ncbi:hypothetical protein NCS52_00169300 [Fusarium sp. LHS14.1]|nr:hypothetical protein NCS52_00169300 [Fusarium sp. LHS14.1]
MYHHCILCRVRIQPHYDRNPPAERLTWRSEIRAVRSERGRCSVFLTGIGYLSDDCLRASDDLHVSYADSPQDLKRYDLRSAKYSKSRTFNELDSFADLFQGCSDDARDCFSPFPLEVNQFIFNFLQSPDLCNLRLASRQIANIAKPAHLPQSFWESRFATDKEMNFFSLQQYLSKPARFDNWRLLYAQVQHTLRNKTLSGHFRNRRRVWQCVGHLTQCLVPLLEQTRSLRDGISLKTELASQGYSIGQMAQGVFRDDDSVTGGVGICLFGRQSLFCAKGDEAKTIQISVSFLAFDCAEYVSGIRVLERSGANPATELSRAGLIMPFSEKSITITPKIELTGIQVASSTSGIVGLGFLLRDGNGLPAQRTAGIINNPPDGVGIATLRPRTGYKVSGFLISLDACKFVSLELLELCNDPGPSKRDTLCSRPWFWHPAEPNRGDRATSLQMPKEETRLGTPTFALDMNFGGTDGSRLSRLNRIVAFHDDHCGSFRGFAFFYTDGSEEAFGMKEILNTASKRWTCIEQSIALDGPGGERIVKLGLVRGRNTDLGNHPQVIKMYTNHGRTLEFQRWHHCRLESSRLTGEQHLHCAPEETITGILTTALLPTGNLQSLGLRSLVDVPRTGFKSRPQPARTSSTFPMSEGHWKSLPRDLQRSFSCFTSVVLSNIRRVGVSAGVRGRTRGPDYISGLCFEFWDSELPVYVGQWFKQVGTLSLEVDERIANFTFWQAQESHPDNDKGENSGRITGVQIRTVGIGQKQGGIRVGGGKHMLVYSFAEKPYEKLHGLAWSFDHQCDYIYSLTQPRIGTSLTLHDIAELSPNSRMPGKIFWQFQDHKGNWLHVSRIQAFFKDHKLSRFIFEYGKNGIYSKVGHVEGDRVSVRFKERERITRMDLMTRSGGVVCVTFRTNENRKHSLFFGSEGPMAPGNFQRYSFDETPYVKKPDTPSFLGSFAMPSSGGSLAAPREREKGNYVGLWLTMHIFPRATDIVDKVGPIFQKEL